MGPLCREAKIPRIYPPPVIYGTQISQFLCLSAGIILFPKVASRKEPKCLNNLLANIPFTDFLPPCQISTPYQYFPRITSKTNYSPEKKKKVGMWLTPHIRVRNCLCHPSEVRWSTAGISYMWSPNHPLRPGKSHIFHVQITPRISGGS